MTLRTSRQTASRRSPMSAQAKASRLKGNSEDNTYVRILQAAAKIIELDGA